MQKRYVISDESVLCQLGKYHKERSFSIKAIFFYLTLNNPAIIYGAGH